MLAEVENLGSQTWRGRRDLPVRLGHRWQRAGGTAVVVPDDPRGQLDRDVPPGASAPVRLEIEAPAAPGDYLLVLDAYRDQIGWLSERGADTVELPIEVLPPLY